VVRIDRCVFNVSGVAALVELGEESFMEVELRAGAASQSSRRVLVLAVVLLGMCSFHVVARLAPDVIEAGRRLLVLDGEGRRLAEYGPTRGYGYIRRVTDGIPRSEGLPRVRSIDENHPSDVVLPEDDWNRESRVVIGIGFTEAEFLARLAEVDGPSFRVVHRSNGGLTAVSPEILVEAQDPGNPWHAWLEHLRHLP
jgi:hypothetical protein